MSENNVNVSKEQELQQKLMMYQVLQGQLEEFKKQGNMLQTKYAEIETANLVLDDLAAVKEGNEILIPIGNGVFVNGKTVKGNVIVDVGAGVMSEKSVEETKKIIEEKKKELETISMNMEKEIITITNKMNQIAEEMQSQMQ